MPERVVGTSVRIMSDVAERDHPTAFSREATAAERVDKGKDAWWGCLLIANTGDAATGDTAFFLTWRPR